MQVSVIMPTYNAASTICEQLDSLACQEWAADWELIIADNGSKDRTVELAETYRGRFPNLRILDAAGRRGAAYARNTGASAANGDVFVFCDADDVASPGWLTRITEPLREYDLVIGHMEFSALNKGNQEGAVPIEHLPSSYAPYKYYVSGAGFAIHRKFHETIGGFDESLMAGEDVDYGFRVQLAGARVYFADDAIMHYRLRPTLRSSYQQGTTYGKCTVMLYIRYRDIQQKVPSLQSWLGYLRAWMGLLTWMVRIRRKDELILAMRNAGFYTGALLACIQSGVPPGFI